MNDKEKLMKVFDELEIEYKINIDSVSDSNISLVQGNKNVGGYNEFVTVFEFDENNKFIQVHLWE